MGKRTIILSVLGFVIIGGLLITPIIPNAIAGPKVLKLSHQWAKGDIRDQWGQKWAELVEKKTNGSVKFRLYPAASLYKAKAQHDALKKGALDACVLPFIYLSGKIPAFAITSMPGVVKNATQGSKWGGAEIGRRLDAIGQQNGFRTMSWGCIMGSVGSKKSPVVVPSDLQGFRVRGAGWAMEEVLKGGGASITSMPSTEVYFALQTGALDGLTTTYSSFLSFRLYEVLDHLTISDGYGVFYAHHGILVSNTAWDRLNESERKALVEAGRETEPFMLELANGILDKTQKTFADKGVKIHDLSEENFNKWFELAKKTTYKTYAQKVPNGQELIDLALQVK
jgi:TRAP-type C4-dicarboxylate transport system substrate-binding protein